MAHQPASTNEWHSSIMINLILLIQIATDNNLMSKLFVVFCKELTQPPKVLKTKSYAKSLLKKNSLLQIKQFSSEVDVSSFLAGLQQPKGQQEPTIKQLNDILQQKSTLSTSEIKEVSQPTIIQSIQKSIKVQDSVMGSTQIQILQRSPKVEGKEMLVPPKGEGFMKYFKPGSTIYKIINPTISLSIRQNQNPGLCQIQYYLQNAQQPHNQVFIGQKYRHQAQMTGVIYALTDLSLNRVKSTHIRIPSGYILNLLKTGTTYDCRLKPLLAHYAILASKFDSISYELCTDSRSQKLQTKFNLH